MLKDVILECKECECKFIFTAEEQERYMLLGIENLPSKCPNCKLKEKESTKCK